MPLPKLSNEQIAWVIQEVAEYIEGQRKIYRQKAVPLGRNQRITMPRFFPVLTVDSARAVVLSGERVGNPPLYGRHIKMGFEAGSLPDFADGGNNICGHRGFTSAIQRQAALQRTGSCRPIREARTGTVRSQIREGLLERRFLRRYLVGDERLSTGRTICSRASAAFLSCE